VTSSIILGREAWGVDVIEMAIILYLSRCTGYTQTAISEERIQEILNEVKSDIDDKLVCTRGYHIRMT
jgi:hypothetical protein